MSRQTIAVIAAVVLILVIASVVLYTLLQPQALGLNGGPGMLYFFSPTCPVCQGMKPTVDSLEETYGDEFKIVRIDITRPEGEELAREYGLVGQPYYLFLDSEGEEARRIGGPQAFDALAQEIELTMQR